jgi:hypothetical protein
VLFRSKSREHVDLWLHGFAMISSDSSVVPLFRTGYRDALTAARHAANAVTDLDANRDALAARLRANPALVNAQFLALSFGNWESMAEAIDAFLKADGNPRQARDQRTAAEIAAMAAAFPSREDRDFARRMRNALASERDRFFHQWWVDEMRRRDAALQAVDSAWQREYRPRLQPFLNHTQQGNGEVVLSLPLEGEGRTVSEGKLHSVMAVAFPESRERAAEAIYGLLHEMVGPLTGPAVDDNTTPAEKRSGGAARLGAIALVRGGALLAARLSPETAQGYARFYLHAAGIAFEGDVMIAFAKAFPVPAGLLESVDRQIAIAFGGI